MRYTLIADPQTGNDVLEAPVMLPLRPMPGDTIEVRLLVLSTALPRVPESGEAPPPTPQYETLHLEVGNAGIEPDRTTIEVWVEGYDLDALERAMVGAREQYPVEAF